MDSLRITAFGDFAEGPLEGVDFSRLLGPDLALPMPPRFTFGPFPAELAATYYGLQGISSIGVYSLCGFDLSGVFLISRADTYFRCPELNVHEAHIKSELSRIAPTRQDATRRYLKGPHVVLAGPGYGVFGHWLAEYLPKISLLNFAGYDINGLRYLLPTDAPSFVRSFLELFHIKSDQIIAYDPEHEVICAEQLLLPTILHNGLRMSPLFKEAADFLKGLISFKHDLRGSSHGPRLFLSRAMTSQARPLENRTRVEAMAADANFTLVHPEKMNLVEQVRMFNGAREVMGEYGSALHGTMFSPPGTVVCALRGTGEHPGFIQSGIGTAMEQPTGYVFGQTDGPENNFRFRLNESAVSAALRLAFGGLRV